MPEFLDMVHRHALLISRPEDHDKINKMFIGRLTAGRPPEIDARAGFAPPSWWRGDEYASKSGIYAAFALKR